jgi:hypothetical protein
LPNAKEISMIYGVQALATTFSFPHSWHLVPHKI